jgi:calpain-15
MPDDLSPNDIIQGGLSDCYFLSALSTLAEKDYRIHNIFVTKTYNHNGYYICKLTFNGIYQEVIVDDLFPVNVKDKPIFAQPAQGKYIWVMVL